ncbi:MAG: glucose-6-phosphate isomerase [Kordiimonadaceae bacterium]|jgi:glucose-6-phosphate isomerase|nr:glucose-6-phosphate isomerase [Kordiimonadaceae bacterium]MBT7544104.1 glucose-6-phosphate isomerase [Kordiimonadaceae bacterium]MBT7605665.1 glucose-6-phosphate isomerase [Kordiimonadaceae bacterium]
MPLTWVYKNFEAFDTTVKCKLMKKLEYILPAFKEKAINPDKPMLSLPAMIDDLAEIEENADRISSANTDVLVLGVGGSSLGGQALIKACGTYNNDRPNVKFTDNLSPLGFPHLLSSLNPKHTHILAISKTGRTIELHALLAIVMKWLKEANCNYKDHITIITETETSPLRKLIDLFDLPSLQHHIMLGGRFSILSNVGLLPAAIAGVNIRELRIGAQEVIEEMKVAKKPDDIPSAVGAAHIISQQQQNNINISVLFLYDDRLRKIGEWYCQLWAESLGKKGVGTTPIIAQGPLDQHSQLQLYMEGPRDKSYSFISVGCDDSPATGIPEMPNDVGMNTLSGLTLHDIVSAMSEGTHHALCETGQPTRQAHMDNLSEKNIGSLIMHFFLETKFSSYLLGVDPYGQPGVERGKVITRKLLKNFKK